MKRALLAIPMLGILMASGYANAAPLPAPEAVMQPVYYVQGGYPPPPGVVRRDMERREARHEMWRHRRWEARHGRDVCRGPGWHPRECR